MKRANVRRRQWHRYVSRLPNASKKPPGWARQLKRASGQRKRRRAAQIKRWMRMEMDRQFKGALVNAIDDFIMGEGSGVITGILHGSWEVADAS